MRQTAMCSFLYSHLKKQTTLLMEHRETVVIMPQKCLRRAAEKFRAVTLLRCWTVRKKKKILENCHHLPPPYLTHLTHTFLTRPKEQAGSAGHNLKAICKAWPWFESRGSYRRTPVAKQQGWAVPSLQAPGDGVPLAQPIAEPQRC